MKRFADTFEAGLEESTLDGGTSGTGVAAEINRGRDCRCPLPIPFAEAHKVDKPKGRRGYHDITRCPLRVLGGLYYFLE